MTRLEAQQAMLLGKKVGNTHFPPADKVEYFFDGKYFKFSVMGSVTSANMDYGDGYFIIEEPLKFKKVTMYQRLYKLDGVTRPRISEVLHDTLESATKLDDTVGYREVEVMVLDE